MAYAGYLMQVGTGDDAFLITGSKYVKFSTFQVTRKVQDLDPYRDANGLLHRNTLPNVPLAVQFDMAPGLTNTQLAEFLGGIQRNYTNALERKFIGTVYVPELDDYTTQDMYMAEPELKIMRIDPDNTVVYETVQIKFVGY